VAGVNEAVRIIDVSKSFGRFRALKDVSLSVAKGERRALIGPNGAGKSTLFNIIGGQLSPSRGRIEINGVDIAGSRPDQIFNAGLTRTFQRNQLFQGLNVWQNVELACAARYQDAWATGRKARRQAIATDIAETLRQVHLLAYAERAAGDLAYGEQRQLELALALAGQPKILLLDEPTAGMSPAETEAMLALILALPRDITVMIVEHDMDVVFSLADSVTVLYLGEVLADGSPSEIQSNDKVLEVYMGRRSAP
jgi:branched-chain amino acid transport system ATP-binding protein